MTHLKRACYINVSDLPHALARRIRSRIPYLRALAREAKEEKGEALSPRAKARGKPA